MRKQIINESLVQMGINPESIEEEEYTSLRDICKKGAIGGVPGFTSYRDTYQFFERNKKEILILLHEVASYNSTTIHNIISNLYSLRDYSDFEIESVLLGLGCEDDKVMVYNAISWLVIELVAFEVVERESVA